MSWLDGARRAAAAAAAAVRGARPSGRCSPPTPRTAGPRARPRPGAARARVAGVLALGRQHRHGSRDTGSGVIPIADDEEQDDEVPGRSWLRLAAVGRLRSCLLLIAIVFAFNLGPRALAAGRCPTTDPAPETPAARPLRPRPRRSPDVTATDLDPQGDPPEENRELAPLAVDGDPATSWRTVTYEQDLGPGGLKTGVGLPLDLGPPRQVDRRST